MSPIMPYTFPETAAAVRVARVGRIAVASSPFAGVSPTTIPAVSAPLPVRERASVGQVLQLAAEYIEVHGHHKGDFAAEQGRGACAVGAIQAIVTGHRADRHPLADAAVRVLSGRLPDVNDDAVENVATWNDEPSRTAVEVTRVLRAAALAVAA